ncbi:MBL fold metallo-hydrolase [Rhizomonospora bruguierae]|uniref:MBL fold metallo-hydrolase n=1 Tax=Rhizomonospora bruguierae TaxID=1581705 RepID=UPI001BCA78D9|nr:MBL fold metallo-hydrolase [Micromonospora sp. NBRC 107566]
MTTGNRNRSRRGLVAAALVAGAAAGLAWLAREVPVQLGAGSRGARLERVRRSPQFRKGAFHNTLPARPVPRSAMRHAVRDMLRAGARRRPSAPIPLLSAGPGESAELAVIWYGHSSALVEVEGRRVLLDPVWSERCSPSSVVGPRRLHAMPVALEDLPALDAVVISHDHYDHLDMATVRALVRSQRAPFVVPLGVGAHLERWGVPAERIVELEWAEGVDLGGVRLTCTAARHFSGRGFTRDTTLWASWVIAGERRRVFYTGDTGYFDGYRAIGAEHGPFDATLAQIGAYGEAWPDIHMTPEEAITAHLDLGGGLLVPVHWGTFVLAPHPWSEPVDRLWSEAKARDVRIAVPRPGERVDVDAPPAVEAWWQQVA